MNLAQMLNATVTPLSKIESSKSENMRRFNSTVIANEERHKQAITRYREVMGDDWITTKTLTDRLGYGRHSIYDTLKAWVEEGIIEKRKVDDGGKWSMKKGYEWRMKP